MGPVRPHALRVQCVSLARPEDTRHWLLRRPNLFVESRSGDLENDPQVLAGGSYGARALSLPRLHRAGQQLPRQLLGER